MARPRRVQCRTCDRHIDDVGPLSARGKCEGCSIAGVTNAIEQVSRKQGPLYDRYVVGMRAYAARLQDAAPDGDV